jgi:peptidoglycan-N-acetylglucosamine deacetylase
MADGSCVTIRRVQSLLPVAVTSTAPIPVGPSRTPPGAWPWPAALRSSVGLHAIAGVAAVAVPEAAPWALAAVLANHAVLTAAGLWPRSALLGPNVSRLPPAAAAQGLVAITIDDGPDPEATPAVLDLLAAHGARATFFCIGHRVRAHPSLVRRMVASGHSVQNHSLRHRHDFSLLGPAALAREVGDAQALLADTAGRLPHCFRAPAGLRNPLLDPVLHRLGLHLVSWTRRGFDTRQADADRVTARLLQGLGGGDIVLLHDGHARRTASGQPVLLQVLPRFLQQLRPAGLHTATLDQALPPRHASAQASTDGSGAC